MSPCSRELVAVRDGDAGALLPAVLDGEEREVGLVGDLGVMAVDAHDAAGLAQQRAAVDVRVLVRDQPRRRDGTLRHAAPPPTAGPGLAGRAEEGTFQASLPGDPCRLERDVQPSDAQAPPPTTPSTEVGTPPSAASRSSAGHASPGTLTTTRDCDSPKSTTSARSPAPSARTPSRQVTPMPPPWPTPRWPPRARRRCSRGPSAGGPGRSPRAASRLERHLGVAGRSRSAGHAPVDDAEVLAAGQLRSPAGRAGRRRSPASPEASMSHRRGQVGQQAQHADDRRRPDAPATRFVVEANVPAHDRDAEGLAGLGDALDDLGQLVVHGRVVGRAEVEAVSDGQRLALPCTRRCGRPPRRRCGHPRVGPGSSSRPLPSVARAMPRPCPLMRRTAASPPGATHRVRARPCGRSDGRPGRGWRCSARPAAPGRRRRGRPGAGTSSASSPCTVVEPGRSADG